MPKYCLYAGVAYTQGEMNLDEVPAKNKEELLEAISKIIDEEDDARTLVMTVKVTID